MLYMIGLGLASPRDISLRGLDAIRSCRQVFLDGYTSVLPVEVSELERLYEKDVRVLPRADVEVYADKILEAAQTGNAAFLVVGDVFGATTHTDLWLRAQEQGVEVEVIHNASILTAIGQTGLSLYRFGRTTTLVYPEGNYAPESFFDVVEANLASNLHTLCLLDIKMDQKRYMSCAEAATMLLAIAKKRESKFFSDETMVVGCARLGAKDQQILLATAKEMSESHLGLPLHSLIVPATLGVVEEEMLSCYGNKN